MLGNIQLNLTMNNTNWKLCDSSYAHRGETICSAQFFKNGNKKDSKLLWLAWNWKSSDCHDSLVKEEATLEDSGLYCGRITIRYWSKSNSLFELLTVYRSDSGKTTVRSCPLGSILVINQVNWKLICLVLIVILVGVAFILTICTISNNPEVMKKWISMPSLGSSTVSRRVSTSILSRVGRLSIGSQLDSTCDTRSIIYYNSQLPSRTISRANSRLSVQPRVGDNPDNSPGRSTRCSLMPTLDIE